MGFLMQGQVLGSSAKINMSYIYNIGINESIQNVDATKGAVNRVSPNYFDINPDGTLKLTKDVSPLFIEEMRKRNIKVIPFLSNHWDREIGKKALLNREALASQIVQAIKDYNLDGVNVDIENVTEVEKDQYTDLVRLLREKLPADKTVSVAVAANPKRWTKGWHGSYDYKALGQYSDEIMLMSYDESYRGSAPGPVASISFVEKSIQYLLESVPAEKVLLGIPFYGRYWNQNEAVGGSGISLHRAEELIKKYNGTTTFDVASKSPKATFVIKAGDPTYSIFGKVLTPGTYTLWYENEQSIKEKLNLVQKYNLRGTGSWSLGQETKEVWEYYDLWANGRYFSDLKNHWSEKDVLEVVKRGWMEGTSSSRFSPDVVLTRAQIATILVKTLDLKPLESSVDDFIDVSQKHAAYRDIQLVNQHGIMLGTSNGRFSPDASFTRAQIAMILSRLFEEQDVESQHAHSFLDIKEEDWYYEAVLIVSQRGIMIGYSQGQFRPEEKVTRAQMAALMNRIASDLENKEK